MFFSTIGRSRGPYVNIHASLTQIGTQKHPGSWLLQRKRRASWSRLVNERVLPIPFGALLTLFLAVQIRDGG